MGMGGRALLFLTFMVQFTSLFSEMIGNTLLQGVNLTRTDHLASPSEEYKLLLFKSSESSEKMYLRIDFSAGWAWLANLQNQVSDFSARLTIDDYGNFKVLFNGGSDSITIYASYAAQKINASATLLNNGNLVLREMNADGSAKQLLWQSFDYPNDILLPGMRLGINWRTGKKWSLASRVGENTPSPGSFMLGMDPDNTKQLVIWWREHVFWTSGSWKNGSFSNLRLIYNGNSTTTFTYVSNENETYFLYSTTSNVTVFIGLSSLGALYGEASVWCNTDNTALGSGCLTQKPPSCRSPNTHFSLQNLQFGYMSEAAYKCEESKDLSLVDCAFRCLNDCSCVAYSSKDNDSTGCKMWGKGATFMPSLLGQMVFFISDEPDPTRNKAEGTSKNFEENRVTAMDTPLPLVMRFTLSNVEQMNKFWIMSMAGGAPIILISFYICYMMRRKGIEACKRLAQEKLSYESEEMATLSIVISEGRKNNKIDKASHEIHIFSLKTIVMATDNFSSANKLGEGGFGPVHKGKLLDGKEIAIKRLSTSSRQGSIEFKNEVKLIAQLQHTNLVKLHGLCVERGERMLIYEYMPNKSLDYYLFDSKNRVLLDWKILFRIIQGVAQGLVYLHKYSRLRVIHRDLKPSNILLDYEMEPKISDFGIAKIFKLKDTQEKTKKIVGTYGYMSPEYALHGIISTKTDVFSFGVVLLEIVSGKRNGSCFNSDDGFFYLIGHAWQLWNEGRALQLIDPILDETFSATEILRCIHISLLCVQDLVEDRPTMLDVVYFLSNDAALLVEPKKPAFFKSIALKGYQTPNTKQEKDSSNYETMTTMDGR